MKKLIALLLVCIMVIGMFAGCDKAGKDKDDETGSVYYLNFKPEQHDA